VVRKENKNWIILDKKILRLGDLSSYQRKSEGLDISPTQAYLKCEDCDQELLIRKHESGQGYG
jgi:hypothetical protein